MNRYDQDDIRPLGRDTEADRDDDTATIREGIEQTRAEMSETIDAIQERLSPSHITEQVKQQVREATIGKAEQMARSAGDTVNEARYTVMETIKHNPIPAAMVGIGLGWLFMNRRSAPSHRYTDYRSYAGGPTYYESRYRQYGTYDTGRREYDEPGMVERGRQAVGDTVHRVQDTAGEAANRAQEAVSNVVSQAQEKADHLASRAQYQAQRVEDRFQQMMYENPLAVGAAALALGAVVGLAAPQTRKEHELMGEARDTLVDKVQDVAQDTMGKVQRVAEEVVDETKSTARQAAKDEGLTSR